MDLEITVQTTVGEKIVIELSIGEYVAIFFVIGCVVFGLSLPQRIKRWMKKC